MVAVVLATKFSIPARRLGAVSRPRLLTRLDVETVPLTLISAPAGSGKTTLVSEWIHSALEAGGSAAGPDRQAGAGSAPSRPPTHFTWLSLDDDDNDLARFLTYLSTALEKVEKGLGTDALALLQSPAFLPSLRRTVLALLINRLSELAGRVVLVLDDYHAIHAQPVHEAVAYLLDHIPSILRMILISRSDPPLPLARRRARGELLEIRGLDLNFTPQEASAFLGQVMGLALSPGEFALLYQRTEGWAVGLQLIALAIRSFPGSAPGREGFSQLMQAYPEAPAYVLDFLVDEVLARQPEEVLAFLLHTSILERLAADLCDSMLGWKAIDFDGSLAQATSIREPASRTSQAMLEHLLRSNLFLAQLEGEGSWYHYHPLFAQVLRKRLRQTASPAWISELHRRAAAWLVRNGLEAEAIEHALAAKDFELTADLIEKIDRPVRMHNQQRLLLGWIEALPEPVLHGRPGLLLECAWTHMNLASFDRAEEMIARVKQALLPGGGPSLLEGEITLLEATLAVGRGEVERASELSRRALDILPDDPFLRSLAAMNLSFALAFEGDAPAAERAMAEAAWLRQSIGYPYYALFMSCEQAEQNLVLGKLRRAEALYQHALELGAGSDGRLLPIAGMSLIGLGEVRREQNDLETAQHLVEQGIALGRLWNEATGYDGYLALARVRQARGDFAGAGQAIRQVLDLAGRVNTVFARNLAAAYQARLWIAQGNPEFTRWMQACGLPPDGPLQAFREIETIILARGLLRTGSGERPVACWTGWQEQPSREAGWAV